MTYLYIALVLILIIIILSVVLRSRKSKEKELKQKALEKFKEDADKLTFKITDIQKKTRSFEGMATGQSRSLLDMVGNNSIVPEKEPPKVIIYTDIYFEFEYNGVKIKSMKTFPKEKDYLRIYFGLHPTIDIYILKEKLEDEDDTEICWAELDLNDSLFCIEKNLYRYYMDFSSMNLNDE